MAMTIEEMRGLLQPSAQDQSNALTMGLLGLGSGLLANSTGHYGQFAPAFGAGMNNALQGFQQADRSARENRMQDLNLRLKLNEWQKQQEAEQKQQAEEQKQQALLAGLTPEQQRIYALGGGKVLAERMLPEPEKTPWYVLKDETGKAVGINPLYSEFEKSKARAGAPNVKTVVNPAIDPFKNEKALRDEYQGLPQVKSAAEMNSAFKMIETAYNKPSAANDLAMATKFMKILDPTSVVRESEFAMAVNASGLMDKVYNYANAIKTGQRLNPVQRKDFYDSAKAINDAFQSEAANAGNKYKGIASQYGLKPENIIIGTEFNEGKVVDFGRLK